MEFFVGRETLDRSNFNQLKMGQTLNLERSLSLGDRLGGHLVSGHVDAVAEVVLTERNNSCLNLDLKVNPENLKFIIPKGSLTVNGVSLTVNKVDLKDRKVSVYLIPETLLRTNLGQLNVGDLVNIECDQLVKVISYKLENYRELYP
jgi:riboflavin synthase